jgi:glycosyltransferase A (GT-A) superfamily protein (DUF2064 family)
MVKAPVAGRVKSRLGREIGSVAAAWWYRHQLARLLRRLQDPRWDLVVAVSPDRALPRFGWGPPPPPPPPRGEGGASARRVAGWWRGAGGRVAVAQGGGDLGQRMLRAIEGMPPGPVLVVGSDIPGLTPAHAARAFRALRAAGLVLGPAEDGGYWALGATRVCAVRRNLLGAVRWSSRHALADTVAALAGRRIAFADTLADVDTAGDLRMATGRRAC